MSRPEHKAWKRLEGVIGDDIGEILRTGDTPKGSVAPLTLSDEMTTYLVDQVAGMPWVDHLTLIAAVFTAQGMTRNTIFATLCCLHPRFKTFFRSLDGDRRNAWNAERNVLSYLKGEFVRAESLVDTVEPAGLWFEELLRRDVIGQNAFWGARAVMEAKQEWLRAIGYRKEEAAPYIIPFSVNVAGLFVWPIDGVSPQFMAKAKHLAEGILIPLQSLVAGALFGLVAIDLCTSAGIGLDELQCVRLDQEGLVRLEHVRHSGAVSTAVIFAPVIGAMRRPFSSTRAQWVTPCSPFPVRRGCSAGGIGTSGNVDGTFHVRACAPFRLTLRLDSLARHDLFAQNRLSSVSSE